MKRNKLNPDLDKELEAEPEHKEAVREAAEKIAGYASAFAGRAGAPWMSRQAGTIEVEETETETMVVNRDHAGHLVEWGSIHNPPHAPLRRGVKAAGFKFQGS